MAPASSRLQNSSHHHLLKAREVALVVGRHEAKNNHQPENRFLFAILCPLKAGVITMRRKGKEFETRSIIVDPTSLSMMCYEAQEFCLTCFFLDPWISTLLMEAEETITC